MPTPHNRTTIPNFYECTDLHTRHFQTCKLLPLLQHLMRHIWSLQFKGEGRDAHRVIHFDQQCTNTGKTGKKRVAQWTNKVLLSRCRLLQRLTPITWLSWFIVIAEWTAHGYQKTNISWYMGMTFVSATSKEHLVYVYTHIWEWHLYWWSSNGWRNTAGELFDSPPLFINVAVAITAITD